MQNNDLLNEAELRTEWATSLRKLALMSSVDDLRSFEKRYLTTKASIIPSLTQKLAKLPPEERKKFGKLVNQWRKELLMNIEQWFKNNSVSRDGMQGAADLFLEGKKLAIAVPHPLVKMTNDIYDFFVSHGYQVHEGPEIDSQWYNFSALNIATDHPSRSDKDTFYLSGQNKDPYLLRTHTSNCQVRILEQNRNKEVKVVSIGKVYRRDDDDPTHSHQYTNCEVVVVGRRTSLVELKGTLEAFFRWVFNEHVRIRLRPSFFPFTEPSFEVDCTCVNCSGVNKTGDCPVCKGTGWVEVLGAGLVHPKVLENSGYDSELFTGFAIGIGVERVTMIKYGISDIRDLYLNDLNFLKQTGWR